VDRKIQDSIKNYAGKRVLVTGGLGMIGSYAATLAADHGATVTVLDNLLPDHGGNAENLSGYEDKIKTVIGDIRDVSVLNDLVKDQDLIFHCAAHVSYTDSMKDPYLDLDINVRGHLNLLEACRHHNKDAKVVFTSSRMKYGVISENPVKESHPTNPLMIYGAHKLLGEKYQEIYYKNYGIPYANVVVPNPFGPRQQMIHHRYGLLNWFIRMAMDGGDITIYGDGSQIRDYIYVEDIAVAILLCGIDPSTTAKTINLGNGAGVAFKKMVTTVIDAVGKGSYSHVEWPENYFNIETGDYIADTSFAESLGYKPSISFEDAVVKTVEFYEVNRSKYW